MPVYRITTIISALVCAVDVARVGDGFVEIAVFIGDVICMTYAVEKISGIRIASRHGGISSVAAAMGDTHIAKIKREISTCLF